MEPLHEFNGRVFGYARVSTDDQNLDMQFKAMRDAGIPESMIYSEHRSGKNMDRPVWKKLLRALRPGDCVVVWKLDRLGRSMMGVLGAIQNFKDDGVHFRSLSDSIDTTTAMGSFIVHISAAFAQLERDMIAERTKAGVEAAKARGVKFGPPHYILSVPERLKLFHKMGDAPEFKEMSPIDIIGRVNEIGPKGMRYKREVSYSNWVSKGYPGLDEALKEVGLEWPKHVDRKAVL